MTANLSPAESAVLAAIDEDALGATLLELLAIPSVTGSAAESECQHVLAGRLDRLGLDVDLWSMDLPELTASPGFPGTEAPTPPGHPLPDLVRAAHAELTGRSAPQPRGAPYGSDLRLYTGAGIATVHFGPGDVRLAHGPRERVSFTETVQVTRALALATLRFLGPA